MKKFYAFPATFERGEGIIGVYFHDLPGITSAGDTMEEAYENAIEALTIYLEDADECGYPVPEPSHISDVPVSNVETVRVVVAKYGDDNSKETEVQRTVAIPDWMVMEADQQKIDLNTFIRDTLALELSRSES